MSQLFTYLFLTTAVVISVIPIIGYLRSKYYYVDTTPIRYWLNKKERTKKRYKTFKKRNKKHLNTQKIHRYTKYVKPIRSI